MAAMNEPLYYVTNNHHLHTIVLLSGDGNEETKGSISFVRLLAMALRLHFKVECWSWKKGRNKAYHALKANHPRGDVVLVDLDNYRDQILLPPWGY